jgi:hypothetical protein
MQIDGNDARQTSVESFVIWNRPMTRDPTSTMTMNRQSIGRLVSRITHGLQW